MWVLMLVSNVTHAIHFSLVSEVKKSKAPTATPTIDVLKPLCRSTVKLQRYYYSRCACRLGSHHSGAMILACLLECLLSLVIRSIRRFFLDTISSKHLANLKSTCHVGSNAFVSCSHCELGSSDYTI